ncbi:MAG TPA: Fe-S-containing protein [Candidatus Binataceae bacterium]|nr:Fe-S-containing protein [Candidatus Binataceae bacterium]
MRRIPFKLLAVIGMSIVLVALVSKSFFRVPCTLLKGVTTLTIRLDDLAPETVRAFCYRDSAGQKLRFLLARDRMGKVHTIFDACGQCYKFHKGYSYSGRYLICRLCGNRYPIAKMNVGKASCVPVPLYSRTVQNQASIRVDDIKAGKWLF